MFRIVCLLAMFWVNVPSAHALTLFGLDFDERAFSDNATKVSGDINYLGFSKDGLVITGDDDIDLDTALNGPDLFAFIEGVGDSSTKSAYVVDIEFLDNGLFNGDGPDLIVWERGVAEPVGVALFDPRANDFTSSLLFSSVHVGDLLGSVDVSPGVNIASINFDLWNIPEDVLINRVRLFGGNGGDPSADIAAVGGLNSVSAIPEPSSFLLIGFGFFMVFFFQCKNQNGSI